MMMNYEEMRARVERIDGELWNIKMCDAYNRRAENERRERALLAEKMMLVKMMKEW